MKTFFITIAAFFIITGCLHAQTRKDVKLYAFKQPVIGGAPQRTTITENGQPVDNNQPRSRYNFLIYMEAPAGLRVTPVELWIEGENYGISSADIKTPVESTAPNLPGQEKKIVLVPQTKNKVVQLNIRPIAVSKANASARAASQANQVVLIYKIGSKFYHAVVKESTLVDPVVLQ